MENKIYDVQEILDQAIIEGTPHFLIKWKNHTHDSDTWEAIYDLTNISDYLQFWLQKRRNQEKSKNYNDPVQKSQRPKFTQYLEGRDHLMKKIKKKGIDKLSQQILEKKKTWEKYVPKKGKIIAVEEEEKDGGFGSSRPRERSYAKSVKLQRGVGVKNEQIYEQESVEEEEKQAHEEQQNGSNFKVVGHISKGEIQQIVRFFLWEGFRCLEVALANGRTFNMKEEDLRKAHPQLLVQFYQNHNIPF